MRMRPEPFISCSNDRTRSASPVTESKGGLFRTGTLTSTCGNLRMQRASVSRSCPVSRITDSRASADTVEGEADPRAGGLHSPREGLRMQRAAARVDVGPVRTARDGDHASAESAQQAWRHAVGGAVGTVDGDRHAAQVEREAPGEV